MTLEKLLKYCLHQYYIHKALVATLKRLRAGNLPEPDSINIEITRSEDQTISYRAYFESENNETYIIAANTIQPKELRIL